jgi:pimeloyl-ACP methyl ester carboxylesterase
MRYLICTCLLLLTGCSNFDSMFVFMGSSELLGVRVDTTLLYNNMAATPNLEWKIVRIPKATVPVEGLWIKSTAPSRCSLSRSVILFVSGTDVSFWRELGERQCFEGLEPDFFTIDLRGYGTSLGKFTTTEQSSYEDGETAIRYLIDSMGYKESSIVLVGYSMGSGVLVEMAKRFAVSRVVLFSPFASIAEASNGVTGEYNIPSKWLLQATYDNVSKIGDIHVPIQIYAGREDMLVPPEKNAQVLYEHANQPKSVTIVPGYAHPQFVGKSVSVWKDSVAVFVSTSCQ